MVYQLWQRLAPPSSARAQLPQMARAALFIWQREGFLPAARYALGMARSLWTGFVAFYITRNQALLASLRPFSYADWIKANEPSAAQLARQREQWAAAPGAGSKPICISYITPVYNPAPDVLTDTIESVLAQTYPHWELCLVDGGSTTPGVHAVLQDYANRDPRIKVQLLERNLGIAGNMNVGLNELATGDFIALLDHDDLVAPHQLDAIVTCLQSAPQPDVVYFDEDKVAQDGRNRLQPWFKPTRFTREILFSTNLLMHSVLRRALVLELGGFDSAMDGAQDWDLAFRLAHAQARIVHLPQVLYHWRQVPGSAARDASAKPWAFEAQLNCVRAELVRLGVRTSNGDSVAQTNQAEAEFVGLGMVRVRWPAPQTRVSIIIPTKNHRELLEPCLTSLLSKTRYADYEIILVDNDSTDADVLAYYEELRRDPRVRIVLYREPFNYSRANNIGAAHAQGDLLLFLNNDTEILEEDWLEELAGWAMRPGVGIVGAKLIRPDATLQHAGIIMGMMGHGSHIFDGGPDHQYTYFGSTDWYREYQAVTGACMMTPRAVFERVGGLDEVYTIGFSDIEYCLRVGAAGYKTIFTPFARVLHKEGGSRGFYLPPADVVRATWQMLPTILPGDPFYNPNLSYLHRIPDLARPGGETRAARLLSVMRDYGLAGYTSTPALERWTEAAPRPVDWPALTGKSGTISADSSHEKPKTNLENHSIARADDDTLNGTILIEQATADPARVVPANDTSTAAPRHRILLVTHDLSLSGAPLVMCMAGCQLQRDGHTVTVVSPLEGPLRELYAQTGVNVCVEPHVLDDVRATARYAGQDWDVVVVNTILGWRVIHTAHAFGRRVIWWLHESGYGRERVEREAPVAHALNVADRVLFPAQATANLYAPWLKANNQVVQPHGLDIDLLENYAGAESTPVAPAGTTTSDGTSSRTGEGRPATKHLTATPEQRRLKILHVGSIEPRKGQDVLVAALDMLPPELSQCYEARFLGRVLDPPYWSRVTRAAAAHPNIYFQGETPHHTAMAQLRDADIFVLSSRDEVLPVTILEAMYHGKAIVATDVGGVSEMIRHEESGFVVESENRAQMAQYIAVLLQDSALRQRLGEAARADFLARFQLAQFSRRLTGIFDELAGQPWQSTGVASELK